MKRLHQKLIFTFFALGVLLFSSSTFAQDTEEFESFIRNVFETRFNGMGETRDPGDFIGSFDPQFRGVIVGVGIDGRVEITQLNSDNIKKIISSYVGHADLHVKWAIVKVNHMTTKEATGVASFLLSSTITKDDEVISTVTNMVEVVAKKRVKGYKISYISIMQVEETLNSGKCYVDIFSNGSNEYVTQLYVPEGPAYHMEVSNFDLGGAKDNRWIRVNDGESIFYWNPAVGDISTAKKDGKLIGKAKSANVAIKMVLKYQNAEKCQMVVSRKKGE